MRTVQKMIDAQKGYEEELTELAKKVIFDNYESILDDVNLDIQIVTPEEQEEEANKGLDFDEDKKDLDKEKDEQEFKMKTPKGQTQQKEEKIKLNIKEGSCETKNCK